MLGAVTDDSDLPITSLKFTGSRSYLDLAPEYFDPDLYLRRNAGNVPIKNVGSIRLSLWWEKKSYASKTCSERQRQRGLCILKPSTVQFGLEGLNTWDTCCRRMVSEEETTELT